MIKWYRGIAAMTCVVWLSVATSRAQTPQLVLSAPDSWVDGEGVVKSDRWIKGWSGTSTKIRWEIELAAAGDVDVTLKIATPEGIAGAKVQVAIGDRKIAVTTRPTRSWKDFAPLKAGSLRIAAPGRHMVTVQALTKPGVYVGDLESVVLTGSAVKGARVIPKLTRADSVHLWWLTREGKITRFYNEVVVRDSYPATFFTACGFHRGYFGMQEVDARGRKIVIFSVWDPRPNVRDPRQVKPADRVILLAKGEGVRVTRFGCEGTGGKSTFEYPWRKGRPYRFLLDAKPIAGATIYTAYFHLSESRTWKLIARFKITGHVEYLRGLYSFVEDWRGHAAHRYPRRALFGGAWVCSAEGKWTQLTRVHFTQAGKQKNVNSGVIDGRFLLATGADVKDTNNGRRRFECKPHGSPPPIDLPKYP